MAYFKLVLVLSFMAVTSLASAQALTPAQKKAQTEALVAAQIVQAEQALALKKANIYIAVKQVNALMERVCQSLKVSKELTNSDRCRSAAQNFLTTNPLPDDDGLDLRLFNFRLSQAMCSTAFVDEHTGHWFHGNNQDDVETTQRTCWGAVIDHLQAGKRSDCSGENENVNCLKNIITDIANTTQIQLQVARQADAQANAISAATAQNVEAEKAKIKK